MARPATLVVLALASLVAAEQADHVDVWHEYFIQDKKVGWSHTTIERAKYDGRPAWWTKSQQELRIKARGVETVTWTDEEAYSTIDFVPLFAMSRREEEGQVTEEQVVVRDGKVSIRRKVNDAVEEKEVDLAGKSIHDQSGQFYASLRLGIGASFRDHSLETREAAIADVTITAEARETLHLAGERHDTTRFRIENSLYKNLPMSLWVRDDGRVVQMKAGPLSMKLSTEAVAKGFGAIEELSNKLPVRPVLLFPERFQEVTLAVHIEGGDTKDLFTEGPYHRVAVSSDAVTLTLLAQPAPAGPTVERPVADLSVAEFMRTTPRCEADDPRIGAKAAEIVGDEKDALMAARRIVRWVYESIRKESSIVGSKTARETLDDMSGDCTEHAVLVAALCRASGIPARCATGLMWVGKEAGYHQWAEVWVGRWLPVDATLDSVGTPPAYLFFGLSDEGAQSAEVTARMMRFFGRARIAVTSVRGAFGERAISEKDTLVDVTADRVDHFGWGVSYPRPEGWEHTLMTEVTAAVFQRGRAQMQLWPIGAPTRLSEDGARDLVRKTLSGVMADLEVHGAELTEEAGRRTYRYEITGRTQGGPMRVRLVLLQESGRTFLVLFSMKDVPSFAEEARAFESFLSQVRFP